MQNDCHLFTNAMCENSGRQLQLQRFHVCSPTTTLFSGCITDILVLLLPTALAAPTANTTRHCCHVSPKIFGLLMAEEGDDRFWAFLGRSQLCCSFTTENTETLPLAAHHSAWVAAPGGAFLHSARLSPFLLQLMLFFYYFILLLLKKKG